jgi:hypothetical protein
MALHRWKFVRNKSEYIYYSRIVSYSGLITVEGPIQTNAVLAKTFEGLFYFIIVMAYSRSGTFLEFSRISHARRKSCGFPGEAFRIGGLRARCNGRSEVSGSLNFDGSFTLVCI